MHKLVLIGIGGFIGSIMRYLISGWTQRLLDSIDFPYGTLAVNILGCVLIGMVMRMEEIHSVLSAEMRLFMTIGILGAFTTFSTFGHETLSLINDRRLFIAFVNISAHIGFGLISVLFGRIFISFLWRAL